MVKWFLVFTFGFLANSEACEKTAMKVYYIDFGKHFFVPPVPIEKHADKVLRLKDCKLDELFKTVTSAEVVGEADPKKGRIKIINGSGKGAPYLLIDDSKQVQWSDKIVKVDEARIQEIISLIESKPGAKKKR
jgi:hypothetical protein